MDRLKELQGMPQTSQLVQESVVNWINTGLVLNRDCIEQKALTSSIYKFMSEYMLILLPTRKMDN